MNRYNLLICMILAAVMLAGGCSTVKKTSPEQRENRSFHYDDASSKTSIVSAMLKKDAAAAGKVSVYAYKGHVFLVGEANDSFRRFAYATASGTKGVSQVTMHWFDPGTAAPSDADLHAALSSRTGVGKEIDPLQASLDVIGGHAVFTGVLPTRQDIDKILSLAKTVPGVKKITSYMIPER